MCYGALTLALTFEPARAYRLSNRFRESVRLRLTFDLKPST
jgi:hypothetical protein